MGVLQSLSHRRMNHDEIKADSMKLRTMLSRCDKLRIPTVAFVKGGCIGGGVGLPFVLKRIGSAQCKCATLQGVTPRRVMMIPERITAADAYRIGLVDRIVESEEAMVQYEAEWRKLVK